MDLQLGGKHVLITGASKGIGFASAMCFAREGARVTLVARTQDALKDAADKIRKDTGAKVDYMAADLSQDAGREAVFAAYPDIDILLNNAGAIKGGALKSLSMQDWRDGFDLKFWGYVHLCNLYVPQMTARQSGTVINIIGMGGRAVKPSYIIGAAGNAALIGFTNAIGAETPKDNVRVFGINPSLTLTDRMTDRLKHTAAETLGDANRWEELMKKLDFPFDRPKSPEEVAALATMLASPQVHYLSGTVIDMDGGGQWRG